MTHENFIYNVVQGAITHIMLVLIQLQDAVELCKTSRMSRNGRNNPSHGQVETWTRQKPSLSHLSIGHKDMHHEL